MNHCSVFRPVVLAVLSLLILAPAARAQLTAEGGNLTAAEAKAEFDKRFAEYLDSVRAIEKLRVDYQSAGISGRATINHQVQEKLAVAKKQLDAMVAAAIEVYRIAPAADPQIPELLAAVVKHYAVGEESPPESGIVSGGDSYEKALPLIELLIVGKSPEKLLPVWGFLAAFATNDYDLAEEYLEQAKADGLLVDPRTLKGTVDQEVMSKTLQFAELLPQYSPLWAKEEAIRQAEATADDLPRVKLATTKGDIVIELFENEAPQAVANFLTLVKDGFYDDVAIHRVLPLFMAQGGDPKGDGTGGPGYSIRCECYEPDFRHHFRGSLSMAHAGRDTGGSQFFLTFLPAPHLDGRHTVFGRVVEGIEILGEFQKRDPDKPQQPEPDRIKKADVLRDRGHAYTFEKLPGR